LQAALDEALSPFRRGGVAQFPREKLAFDDATDELRRLQVARLSLSYGNGLSVRWEGSAPLDDFAFDFDALRDLVLSHGSTWSGRLADVEPDFHAFVRRFSRWKERDRETSGYGQWLNPLGRWDWWELGGRFDGVVSRERRNGAGSDSMISSGPNKGRDLLGGVIRAFGGKLSEAEAEIAANIDLVSALLEAGRRGDENAFPTAVVLPVDACADELRWFDALGWRPIPADTKALLSVADDASFKKTVLAAWERFDGMAVAGVAYHF
jgi:hypothetical protein